MGNNKKRIPPNKHPEELIAQAQELARVKGLGRDKISKILGVSPNTIKSWIAGITHERSVEDSKTIPEELLYLRRAVNDLKADNKNLREIVGSQKELAAQVAAAVRSDQPYKKVPYEKPKRGQPVIPTLVLSDWHIGEVTNPEDTEGFGAYNFDIAERRIFTFTDGFIKYVETQRAAYSIDTCQILSLGDMISGGIHDELRVTNEFPEPVQVAKAGLLQAEVIRRIAPHFKNTRVLMMSTDNHSRTTKKTRFKQRGVSSWGYLVNTITQVKLDRHDNVECVSSHKIQDQIDINGWSFLTSHGNDIRGWAGIPYYGMQRSKGREAIRRMNRGGFDYMVMAHFHVPSFIENSIIINGSLSGTNEFDHGQGRHALPSQMAFMVHPEHGVFNLVPFLDRDVVR